jgi:antitoxin HicB
VFTVTPPSRGRLSLRGEAGSRNDANLAAFVVRAVQKVQKLQEYLSTAPANRSGSAAAIRTFMGASRSQIGRLLDPKDGDVTLATLQRAASPIIHMG